MSDELLLEGVVRGDQRALRELYERYLPQLIGFLSRLAPRCRSDEIVDDTFMAVWQYAARFRHTSKVSTWIFGIAFRVAMKSLRQDKRWSAVVEYVQLEGFIDPTKQTEERDWLAQGLSRLNPDKRMSLMLVYYHGHTLGEVAAMTGSPISTVKARLFHARQKMRDHLDELCGSSSGGATSRAAARDVDISNWS